MLYHARRRLRPPSELAALQDELLNRYEPPARAVYVYAGGCQPGKGQEIAQAFLESIGLSSTDASSQDIGVFTVGCHGLCSVGPSALVVPPGIFYAGLTAEDVHRVVEQTVLGDEIVSDLTLALPGTQERIPLKKDIPFFQMQTRRLMRNCGELDPQHIEDSLMRGAYSGLARVLEGGGPCEVTQRVEAWGLRGRGIATGLCSEKWASFMKTAGRSRRLTAYVRTWNPAAQADYVLIEGDPHLLIEGMALAALATGCTAGRVLVPAERPCASETLKAAVAQAYAYGILGDQILGTGFSFEVDVETGKLVKYPYEGSLLDEMGGEPAELFHNVETLANLPHIVTTERQPTNAGWSGEDSDTVLVALGKGLQYQGVAEVTCGKPVGEVVEELGGGPIDGEDLQAVSLGGPLGQVARLVEKTGEAGWELGHAVVGPGAADVSIVSARECMVDLGRQVMGFLAEESCGKCAPCRIGTTRMREILHDFCHLEGSPEALAALWDAAYALHCAGGCEQGVRGAGCLLSILKDFEDVFLAHVAGGSCPAHICGAEAAA